jgi:hypothetical protein
MERQDKYPDILVPILNKKGRKKGAELNRVKMNLWP